MRTVSLIALTLAMALACGSSKADPVKGTPGAAPDKGKRRAAPVAPPADLPRALPRDVPREPPQAAGPPDRIDRLWVKPRNGCASPGRYRVDHPADETPSLLIVEGNKPRTLVVLLHGGSGDAKKILRQTRLDGLAKQEGGIALLVPKSADYGGRGTRWNTGKWSHMIPESQGRDDVRYLDALVDMLKDDVCAEEVLAVGFSNGGQMAQRWACEGENVDAMLTAAGTLLVDPGACDRPVPLRSYVGKDDPIFKNSPLEGVDFPSVQASAQLWAGINGCEPEPHYSVDDDLRKCAVWAGCNEPVTLCVVKNFPHGWPAPWGRRNKSSRVSATTEGWAWYRELD